MVVELVAPGIGIMCKTRADLVEHIKSSGFKDATETQAAFREGAAAARALFELLRAAETRLSVAITAAVQDELSKPNGNAGKPS